MPRHISQRGTETKSGRFLASPVGHGHWQCHLLTVWQALARAVYNRKPVVILDDVFKGLDADTYAKCFSATLGPGGLMRQGRTAVIMATHNGASHLHNYLDI